MNDNEHSRNEADRSESISARNIEHLLTGAYAPEDPDDLFVARVSEKMVAVARSRSERRSRRRRRVILRSGATWRWGGLAAAAVVLIAMGLNYWVRPGASPERPAASSYAFSTVAGGRGAGLVSAAPAPSIGAMTAQKRPVAPLAPAVGVGSVVHTELGERRRLVLADGAVVYVNQNTTMNVTGPRRLTVYAGEVYVEVPPLATAAGPGGETFVIRTPDREVTALGTHLGVQVAPEATGVIVTQGKVRVSGFGGLLYAGQHLIGEDGRVADLPRATHVLDWARDLMAAAEPPLVPPSKYAGGALVAKDVDGGQVDLSLRAFHVDVHVEDGFARTTIDQTYFNHAGRRLEGTFYFPLPPDASLSRLAMYVDGKLNEGGMVERQRARQVYQSIKDQMKDPALLEWVDGTTFKMRVFPLEARQEKRIVLSYTQRLPALYGRTTFRFPAGHTMKAVGRWSFHARLKNAAKTQWVCDSHVMGASVDGGDLLLDAQAADVRLDRDVVVGLPNYAPGAGAEGEAKFSSAAYEDERYFMVRFRPKLPVTERREKRHWVFLFESSADRDPLLARTQIDVVRGMLSNAEHNDTFIILAAGTGRTVYPQQGVATATQAEVHRAIAFLDGVQLIGSLDLAAALEAAAPLLIRGSNAHLVHVGSGLPVLGDRDEAALLRRLPDGVRYVGVGVGKRWSRSFMKSAAAKTGGFYTQINPDEKVAWRAFDLLSTLNTPRLLNVRVDVASGSAGTFLTHNDSLAQGEELCAILRTSQSAPLPDVLTVHGLLDGKNWTVDVPVGDVAGGANYLPRIWTRLEIDRLLAEDRNRNHDRIVALSKAMYVMSPFTSLLVLENEKMYREYNVDRGRKDHWALYPCPETISVVPEPLAATVTPPARPAPTKQPPPPVRRDWRLDVLGTLPVRVHAPLLQPAGRQEDFDYVTADPLAIETTVSIPDGGTLVLGGQEVAGELGKDIGAPLLSKLPILNRAFTNRATVRDEDGELILVRPRIRIANGQREYTPSGLNEKILNYGINHYGRGAAGRIVNDTEVIYLGDDAKGDRKLQEISGGYNAITTQPHGYREGTLDLTVNGNGVVTDWTDGGVTSSRRGRPDLSTFGTWSYSGGAHSLDDFSIEAGRRVPAPDIEGIKGKKSGPVATGYWNGDTGIVPGTHDELDGYVVALKMVDLGGKLNVNVSGSLDSGEEAFRGFAGTKEQEAARRSHGLRDDSSSSFSLRDGDPRWKDFDRKDGRKEGSQPEGPGGRRSGTTYEYTGEGLDVNGRPSSGRIWNGRDEVTLTDGKLVAPVVSGSGRLSKELGYLVTRGELDGKESGLASPAGGEAGKYGWGTHRPPSGAINVGGGVITGSAGTISITTAENYIRTGGAVTVTADATLPEGKDGLGLKISELPSSSLSITNGSVGQPVKGVLSRTWETHSRHASNVLGDRDLDGAAGRYVIDSGLLDMAGVTVAGDTVKGGSLHIGWEHATRSLGDGPIDRLERIRGIRKQEPGVEFEKSMNRSHEALLHADATGDFRDAEANVRLAGSVLENNRGLYLDGDYRRKREQVEQQLRFIQQNRERSGQELGNIHHGQARDDEKLREKQHQVDALAARAKDLTAGHKYNDAREELEQIVKLDPTNTWAVEQKEMLDEYVTFLKDPGIRKNMLEEEQKSLVAVREAQIPWYKELMYPRDWKELTRRRGASDLDVRAKLATRLQKLDFDDIEFSDVVQFLRDVSGLSIYVKWQALSAAGVEKQTTVTIHLGNVTVEKALRVILDDVGGVNPLGFLVDEGVVTITSREELQSRTITRVYDVRDIEGVIGNFADLVSRSTLDDPWTNRARPEIRELYGQYIVTHTHEAHRAITTVLENLRRDRGLDERSAAEWRRLQGRLGRPGAFSRANLLYQRPVFAGSERWLTDLTLYADGLRTKRADVLAALAAAAPAGHRPRRGAVEPGARTLLEAVRRGGWQRVRLGAAGGAAPTVTVDRAGRFVYDRTRPGAPAEHVLCDGQTLLHVYPEIGLAGRRTVSRFHRAELTAAVPWVVPPADDLAIGATVTLESEHVVAVTPLGERGFTTHLVFAPDGRLVERRLVALSDGRTVRQMMFRSDGRVRLVNASGIVLGERQYEVAAATAPNLHPDLSALVVLPVPQRWTGRLNQAPETVAQQCPGWNEADAMSFIAAASLSTAGTNSAKAGWAVIQKRFLDKGDRRIGLYVLAAAANEIPAVPGEHASRPVGRYLTACTQFAKAKNAEAFAAVGAAGEGFVQDLGRFRRLWHAGRDKVMREGKDSQALLRRAAWHNEVLDYARVAGTTPLTWALLVEMASHAAPDTSTAYPKLVEAFERFRGAPGMGYAARYEAARVLHKLNDPKARERFAGLFIDALRSGVLPAIDEDFHAATATDGTWRRLIDVTLASLLSRRAYSTAAVLAWQVHYAGDTALAGSVLARTRSVAPPTLQWALAMAGLRLTSETGQWAQADEIVSAMLASRRSHSMPWLWRLGAHIAAQRERTASAAGRLGVALEIEYWRRPEQVDMGAFRADHEGLLRQYGQIATSIATLHPEPPRQVVESIVRAADRWRSVDADPATACKLAAAALRQLGAKELAWAYLTTPMAGRPGESSRWVALATELAGENESALADRAYVAAFESDPSNPQILLDRAHLLQRSGQADRAREIFRRIVEGTWSEQHKPLQEQARTLLGG